MTFHSLWHWSLVGVAAVSGALCQGAEPGLAFKGDNLGMSLRDFEARHDGAMEGYKLPYFPTQTPELHALNTIATRTIFPFEESSYGYSETLAGVNARIVYFFQADTPADLAAIEKDPRCAESNKAYLVLIEATFDHSDFSAVLDALTVKYGKPTQLDTAEQKRPAQANLGSRTAQWSLDPCEIDAQESPSGRGDRSEVRFSIDSLPDVNADTARRNSKDL